MAEKQRWVSRGCLIKPHPSTPHAYHHCLLPTPILSETGLIELYFGATDENYVGRTFRMTLSLSDEMKIVEAPTEPVLSNGFSGDFDELGAVPSSIVKFGSETLLFYSGFGRKPGVPYTIFTGLSSFHAGKFLKKSESAPLIGGRGDRDLVAGAFVLADAEQYRMWILASTGWTSDAQGKKIPVYDILSTQTSDPLRWNRSLEPCISRSADRSEIGFSRPWIIRGGGKYRAWLGTRRRLESGLIGYGDLAYAESPDGSSWHRLDMAIDLVRSGDHWDSEMICYPAVLRVGRRLILFYSGNGNGRGGLGWAELES